MPVPGTQEIRKALLEAFKGEAPRNFVTSEILDLMAEKFGLNLNELSSGDKSLLKSRVNEAKSDLKKNNLLCNPSGHTYMITKAGTEVLEDNPPVISDDYLAGRKNKILPVAETFGLEAPETEPVPEKEEVTVEVEPEPDEEVQAEPSDEVAAEAEAEIGTLETVEQEIAPEVEIEVEEIETETEDFAGEEFDEAPEEILDTEEEYTEPMSESINEPVNEDVEEVAEEIEEVHEDLTPTEPEPESETETESESESEDEDDSFLEGIEIPSTGIEDVIARHNSELADEILMKTAALPSDKFEMLVIDLLSKMGYFAFQTARYTTESSGSGLIHGVILDQKTGANIYIQARKLSPGRTIGRADIQDFIDELSDKGGKGIFATTASFSENAKILANDERIMLIDGEKLASLMIANNFCVNVEKVYEIKAIDAESFSEYEE